MFPFCNIKEDELKEYYKSVSRETVLASLAKDKLAFTDLVNLLSPAAASCLEPMRELSAKIKFMNFGKTVRLYAPLYISNHCINDCVYCGFRRTFHSDRRRLDLDGIMKDAEVIRSYGMDSLLLVSGEDPKAVSVDFIADAVKKLKKIFSYVSIEIYPVDEDGYRKLFNAGVHGMTIYQETYNKDLYGKLHLAGPKADYDRRLRAPADAARAGFYNIGLGALLGLYDWRIEAVSLAAHGVWMKKNFWKTRVQFSFPRITPVEGEFQVPNPVSEAELEQMMLAFRIFFREADLYISTREQYDFRRKMALACVSHMSAGSKVAPGAYSEAEDCEDLGQFTVKDASSVEEVRKDLEMIGLEPVFKDWDSCFGAA